MPLPFCAAKTKDEGRKMMVVSIAPAVRVAISEPFGLAPGAITVGQLVAGLRKLGFDQVFGEGRAPASTMHACMHTSEPPSPALLFSPIHVRCPFALCCADTLFAADLTIMEEGTELLHRLAEHLEGHPNQDEPMPMFTSCCPGWVGEQP